MKYNHSPDSYEKGRLYEQFVIEQWPLVYPKRTLTLLEGKQGQLRGETQEGVEIKFDDLIYKYCTTGRLYIETKEKANVDNADYYPSGIYREDNTKMYLIGDRQHWWLFTKKMLQVIDKLDPPFLYRPKPTPSSKGFCVPLVNADRLCIDKVVWND